MSIIFRGDGYDIIRQNGRDEIHFDNGKVLVVDDTTNWLNGEVCKKCERVGHPRAIWLWIPQKKGDSTSNNGAWYHANCLRYVFIVFFFNYPCAISQEFSFVFVVFFS